MARMLSETAKSIGECLGYLLEEATEVDMHFVALHLKLAMMEAEEVQQNAIAKERGRQGKADSAARPARRSRPRIVSVD